MRIKRYTKPSEKLFNLIATDIERPLPHITHRLSYPEVMTDMAQVLEKLQPVEREVRSEDGKWYIARLLPYRTAEDRIEGLVLSFIDITSRKSFEAKLDASEQRMRLVAASTKDYAISTTDMEGTVTSWNSGANRLFGYSEGEIVGQSLSILFTPEDAGEGVFEEVLRRARLEGRAEKDIWHVRKDGVRVFCSSIISPLADNEALGYSQITRDLTGSKRVQDQQEAQLAWEKQERVRAEEATRLRDEFFAVLSHELKQPLNLILLTAEMLARLPEAAVVPAVVRGTYTIKHMVETQAKLIDDLMDLSRLHTGKLTLIRTHLNLTQAVSHVASLMMADATKKNISVDLELASSDLIVQGDLVRIEQVIWNLVSNALKFTPVNGKVTIRLTNDNEDACLEVSDNGKGIAQEILPSIFEMFRQGDTGTTRKYGGMGIGLALVKELVISHGGRVKVESAGEGLGTEFRVFLPLAISQYASSISAVAVRGGLTSKRVLLVDDVVEMLDLLGEMLEMEGAIVVKANNAMAALQIARTAEKPFHLIISDIGMPDMDGYELLTQLRSLGATDTTPAIALSGFTRPSDVEQALAAGFETHVRKPVALDQFIATASRICK